MIFKYFSLHAFILGLIIVQSKVCLHPAHNSVPFMLKGITLISPYDSSNYTRYERSFEHTVLKRVSRAVVFPKNAAILLTLALAKAVVGGYPRGLNYGIEFDMYRELPDSLHHWKHPILENKPKHKDTKLKTNLLDSHVHYGSSHGWDDITNYGDKFYKYHENHDNSFPDGIG